MTKEVPQSNAIFLLYLDIMSIVVVDNSNYNLFHNKNSYYVI